MLRVPDPIQFPGGPRPDEPVSREPISGVDLATYAKISAELAEGKVARKDVLRACGFDELRWAHVEQGWLVRIATAALRGDASLATDLDRLYLEAQDALGPTEPMRGLDRYAWLVARMERGEDPADVYASDGLSLPDAARLQRAWTKRLVSDEALMSTFRGWVERLKRGESIS
jgi:hypothetical protein